MTFICIVFKVGLVCPFFEAYTKWVKTFKESVFYKKHVFLSTLKDTARYAGLLLAFAEGFARGIFWQKNPAYGSTGV